MFTVAFNAKTEPPQYSTLFPLKRVLPVMFKMLSSVLMPPPYTAELSTKIMAPVELRVLEYILMPPPALTAELFF